MEVKHMDIAIPVVLHKKLEREKSTRVPRVSITHLIVEAIAEKYNGTPGEGRRA